MGSLCYIFQLFNRYFVAQMDAEAQIRPQRLATAMLTATMRRTGATEDATKPLDREARERIDMAIFTDCSNEMGQQLPIAVVHPTP